MNIAVDFGGFMYVGLIWCSCGVSVDPVWQYGGSFGAELVCLKYFGLREVRLWFEVSKSEIT